MKNQRWLFALLMLVLVPLEIVCAYLAYETIGEVVRSLYLLAVGINLVFIVLVVRHPMAAALGAVALALVIIPYQVVLGNRLMRVQAETARIVSYAYEHQQSTGAYPASLGDYEFHDSEAGKYIQDYRVDDASGGFTVAYRVGTENTSRWYSPSGGWGYYSD